MLLPSVLRRSTGAIALRNASLISFNCRSNLARSAPTLQRRTFLTSPRVTSYVMSRAKVLHLAARSFLNYNQIITLDSASSPLSPYFTRCSTLRERVYMYLVCLIPPDQTIDLAGFLNGARQAAHAVFSQLYNEEHTPTLGTESFSEALADIASADCVDKWTSKLEAQRMTLRLPVGTKFKLEKLEVHDVRLAGAEYEYSDAAMDQNNDTCSIYHMNEAVRLKVRYVVTEHLLASRQDGGDYNPTRHTVKTTFDWSFYSDVSRAQLVDWHITKATPFKVEPIASK
ncbi:hypothetical protein GN244_ATG14139 [Phytophthora infestans]|uniref:Uncharacterized protein n=1 Tax=Phytophthora infestans TaxID=4787 RepID=A0A833SWP9_PHYIN|nr:hypothetical protein GN244_ATG14139 [Phytophthora infestans]KAF4144355.1 hypothetical protein GN958_ATG06449 [Phytophthora infestans]